MQPTSVPDPHKVQLEVFDGPLDLLLYLIKKSELDIHDIPIEQITDQYMEYLNVMKMLDLNIAGEFLVMAATLMLIKSRMLLPVEERPPIEEEEDDPRWELVKQLIEYRKFKDAASFLHGQEIIHENMFDSTGSDIVVEKDPGKLDLDDVSIFDLIAVFSSVLKDLPTEDMTHLFHETYSVADKIECVLSAIRSGKSLSFVGLLHTMRSRVEIACTFIAVLELIRLHQIRVNQDEHFGDIVISIVEAE